MTWSARSRRTGHALGHQPRRHRGGDGELDWLAELMDLPAAVPLHRPRRRGHPGLGLLGDAGRHPGRPAPGQWGPLAARWASTAATARTPRRTGTPRIEKAARIAGLGNEGVRAIEVDPETQAMRPARCARRSRRTWPPATCPPSWWRPSAPPPPPPSTRCRRSGRSAPSTGLAARRRRVRGGRRRLPRAALVARRRGVRRLVLLRPAQVAAHRLRLRRVLGGRPGRTDRGADRDCRSSCATPPPNPAR